MKNITTYLRSQLPGIYVGVVLGALVSLLLGNSFGNDNKAMPTNNQEPITELPAPEAPDYPPAVPALPYEADQPPFMGWEYWGFSLEDALTVDDIVIGGTYCQVNAQYGPMETFTVIGELTTAGEINPDGNEYTADSNVFPVDDGWHGYIYTGDFGLEPYSPGGPLNEVNRTFEGPCPGGDTEFEQKLDELERMIEVQENTGTALEA